MLVINNCAQPKRLFLYFIYKQGLILPGNPDTVSYRTPCMSNVYTNTERMWRMTALCFPHFHFNSGWTLSQDIFSSGRRQLNQQSCSNAIHAWQVSTESRIEPDVTASRFPQRSQVTCKRATQHGNYTDLIILSVAGTQSKKWLRSMKFYS